MEQKINELQKKPVKIIITWNGVDKAFQNIEFDEAPIFEFVLFNYSGNNAAPDVSVCQYASALINYKTEFKGRILQAVYHLYKEDQATEYICFMDDDIAMRVSSINLLIQLGYTNQLDAFQAAVHPESFFSYRYNVWNPEMGMVTVPWVEIMMPFYRKLLFDAAHEFYETNISSYGIDNFVIPYYQQLLGLTKTAVLHQVTMKHCKPVTDGSKVFSNGLTARQEGERARKKIIQKIKEENLQHFDPDFLRDVLELKTFRWKAWKNLVKDRVKQLF